MKNLKLVVWIFLIWLFQTVFLKFIRIDGIGPELLYVFVLCMALNEKKPCYYISVGIICALLTELSSGRTPGFFLIIYICSVFAVVGLEEIIYKDIFMLIIPIVFVLTFLQNVLYFFINHSLLQGITFGTALKSVILPTMIYNTIAAVIINPILKKSVYPKKKFRRR